MSRIGRLPITIPAGVTVEIAENNVVTVKGPKGTPVSYTHLRRKQRTVDGKRRKIRNTETSVR